MSPIALVMNLVLAALLLSALGFGVRLERRLKALRDGQASFAGAVADLDRAARRAEQGLAALRQATEETVDLLAGRIEKARELAARLDGLTADAARPIARAPGAPRRRRDRAVAGRPADKTPPPLSAAEDSPPRWSRRRRLTVWPDWTPDLRRSPAEPRPARSDPRPTQRSRASIDDELFDSAPRTVAGARR